MKNIAVFSAILLALPVSAQAQAYLQVHGGLDSVSVQGESEEGAAYGLAAGYDITLSDNLFAGIEASLDDSSTKACVSDFFVLGDKTCVRTGRDLAAIVKLGTQVGPNGQLYVLGGYTNARIVASYDDGFTKVSGGENGDGLRLGAGYRHNFSDRFFGKIEYRYSNYESDFSRHNALAGLGIRF